MPRNTDKIALFYLPSYSPELNPQERLNADLKHAIGTEVPVRTKAKLPADHHASIVTELDHATDKAAGREDVAGDAFHAARLLIKAQIVAWFSYRPRAVAAGPGGVFW